MTLLRTAVRRPITWILAVALAAALFVFRDYGLTWDEPLFYRYADALGYAYAPANWFSGTFDLTQSYGPSADDHKTRGPGYLLLARLPARALQALGWDVGSAWHLVNFCMFLLGIYFVYKLCVWLAGDAAGVLGALLFVTQPLLWGHAFINPKDMPFLVLLTGTIWLGVRMVDGLAMSQNSGWDTMLPRIVLPAICLGLATANRVLGPLGGLLVAAYWLFKLPYRRTFAAIAIYGALAMVIMVASWPYLWEDARHFFEVFGLMAQNPTVLPVLFAGSLYRADELPLRYLPFYLGATLTEPVWPLFVTGIITLGIGAKAVAERWLRFLLVLIWLIVPLVYALVARPPLYDGMRHMLFVTPPIIAIGAAGLAFFFRILRRRLGRVLLAAAVLAPGLVATVQLHPYEYAYFNSLVGGTGGAFRNYETDYWLTCYKESVERFNAMHTESVRLFVHREADVAAPYAASNVQILEERGAKATIVPGDFVLVNTRSNEDLHTFRGAPEVVSIGRVGATFCVIKRVP